MTIKREGYMSNLVMIAAVEAEAAARELTDASVEDRARAAMRAVQRHWLVSDCNDQFAAACEGLARVCSAGERERIECELRTNMALNALLSGVPVDLEAALAAKEAGPEPIGLSKIWHAVCSE